MPVDAYRGAGRPEATYLIERTVDKAAREMGIDPAELRRRNFITQFPYQTPVAVEYDSGDYNATLDKVLEAHRILMDLNDSNREAFRDLVSALEKSDS